jgi:hypothetical protein
MCSPIRIYIYVYLLNKSTFFLVDNDVSYNFNISGSLLSLLIMFSVRLLVTLKLLGSSGEFSFHGSLAE